MARSIRVYPDGDVWVVKKDDAARASVIENTKEEALRAARNIALNQGLTIIIHGKDGRIQRTVRPEESSNGGSGCFITTACLKYYGLKDDCNELQTLRKFRDSYLLKSNQGKTLVRQYYSIAPSIVQLIELDKNKDFIFHKIFTEITSACSAISNKQYDNASTIYRNTILFLLSYFKLL